MSDPRRGFPSASAMYRIAACPGSWALVQKLRASGRLYELPDSARAAGTRIHRWLKMHALGEREIDQIAGGAADLGTARQCVELRERQVEQWIKKKGNGELDLIVEWRLWYRQGLYPRFTGQPDYVLTDCEARRSLVVNYKTGRLEAEEAADNLQLRTEIVLLKHNFPDLAEIAGTIIEPNVSWQPETVIYQGEDFVKAESHILAIVARAEWDTHRRAGPWCTRCPAVAHCQEALEYVKAIPEETIVQLPRGPAGVDFWERIKAVKKLVEQYEKFYTEILAVEPDALPGYILPKQGRRMPYVPFPQKFKDSLAGYLDSDQIDGCAEYHLTRIKELIGLKANIAGKELDALFSKLTAATVAIRHAAPSIRKLTKTEKADGNKD